MIRDDFLMRQLAQFIQLLRHVLKMMKEQRFETALASIDLEFERYFGLNSAAIGGMTQAEFLAVLESASSGPIEGTERAILAALLKEAGTAHAAFAHQSASEGCYLRALELLLPGSSEALEKQSIGVTVEDLHKLLRGVTLPREVQQGLFRYYEGRGDFASAEDVLFDMLAREPGNIELLDAGVAFFQRLLSLSDDCLTKGRLPRDEVRSGLAELEASRA